MEVPDEVHHVQRILSSMQKTLECMICLDLFDEPSQTKCGHTFCTTCLHQLTKKPAPCPLCKERLTRRSFSADHQAAALATAVRRLVGAVQEDCGFNVSPSKFRPRPSIEAVESGPAARSTPAPPAAAAGTSSGGGDQQRARTGAKKPPAKNVRTAGTSARRRRSPPRHVYSRAAAVAAEEELDLLSASQVIEFDGERVGEALAPPPPPLPPPAERRVSGRTRVHQWLGGAQEIGFGISEVESPSVARLDQIRETDGGRLERKLQEEKRRLGVAPLDGDGEDDDKENRVDVSVTEGTVGAKDVRKIVAESVDDAESTRDDDAPHLPATSGTSKRFFKARASSAEGTPSVDTQTQTQTEGTQEKSGEDPYQFISSQRTPPKKKKKQRAGKKTKPSAAKKLTVTKKAPPSAASGEDGGGPVPVDFDDLEPEAAANRRRAPPRRARQAAIRAAEFLALPGDVTLSQESGADSDFEPPASKKTRRVASAVKPPPPPPAPVTPKLALARAELGSASQEVRALQELFDDAAPAETGTMTPRAGGTETMTRAEALRKSAAGEQEEAVTPKSVTFSEDVTIKEIPRERRGEVEESPEGPVDAEELRGVIRGDGGDGDPGRISRTSATGHVRQQQVNTVTTERRVSKMHASKPQAPQRRTSDDAKTDANTTTSFAVTDGDDNDMPPSQCSLSAPELAAAGLPPPAAARSPGWSRLPKLKNSFGLKTELAVSGGRRTPTKDEPRRGDTTVAPAPATDGDDGNAPDEPPPSPTSRIDDEATASSGDEAESEGFTASQHERTGRRVSQYKRAVKELEQEVLAMETEMVAVEGDGTGEPPPPVPETEAVLEEDGPLREADDAIEMDAEGGEVEEEAEDDEPPPLLTPQESSNARSRSSRSSNTSAIAASFPAIIRKNNRPPSGGGGRGNTTPQSESLLPAGEERCDSELLASESIVPNSEVDSVEAPVAARTSGSAQASVPAKGSSERRSRSSGGNAAGVLSVSRSNIPASATKAAAVEKPSKVSSISSDATAMTASTSVVANSRPAVALPAAASANAAAGSPASLPTPDSEDFQVDVGGGAATGQRHHRSSGSGRAGRLSRASPRRSPAHAAAAASGDDGKPTPPPPTSPGPRRTGAVGPGRRRVVRGRRGAPSRRLLVRLLTGQRRLTELVGRLTEQLGRLRGSPAAAVPGADGRSPAARSGRLSSAVTPPRTCTRGTAVTPQQTSTRGTSVSSATPAFSPSERPGARRSTTFNANAAAAVAATDADAATNANADANEGIGEVGASSPKVTEVKQQGDVPRSPRTSTGRRSSESQMKSPTRVSSRSRSQAGSQAASQAAVEAVPGSPRAVGSPRSTRRSQAAAAAAAAGSASPRTLRTRSSGSSFVPPTVSSSIPGGPELELAGLPQRRSARRSLAGLADGAATTASSSSVIVATAADDVAAAAADVDNADVDVGDDGRASPVAEEGEPEAGTEFVSPSPSSPSARGELSALMLRSPVPAPESGPPPESLVADSEEIPPMSITQFERVAKDMEAEAAPPPPKDLCDLDTEEVDCLLEGAPAVVPGDVGDEGEDEMDDKEDGEGDEEMDNKKEEKRLSVEGKRRSGSVGSHKRASSPLGSDVSGKRRRSGPTTPASVTKGTRDDPEVVSDDDENLLSDWEVRPPSRGSIKNKSGSLNASRRQTLLDDDKPVEDVDEPMEDEVDADIDAEADADVACSVGRASAGAEKPADIRGTPAAGGGGSGSTTDSPVCRAPASARRRAARISDDEAEQEDEFGSDADDREEMRRLAAMPVDEFIREIQGEVGAPPAAESTRRISVGDDEEVEETGRKDAEADKSITDSMMQEVDLPAGDDSICEIPADSSLAVREDESIVGGEGKQSRRSAGRSLNDIDPDLAESADPAPPGSQDSMAEIIVSSGEVNSPGRVAGLDTVLVTPGGRRRGAAGAHSAVSVPSAASALNSPKTRRSGRVMTAVTMADGGAGGDTPTSTRGSGIGVTRNSGGATGSLRGSPIKNRTPPSAERSAQPSAESRAAHSTGRASSSSSRPKPDLPPELPSGPSASAAASAGAASAPESDLIPESPAAVVMGTSLRRSSAAPPPPPPAAAAGATSPSSEDLLVPANFFNESSLCVPAGEASALEAASAKDTAANASIRKETTPGAVGVPASLGRRSVLPSVASGASDTPAAATGAAAAAATAGASSGGKADAGGAGDGGDVSETESEDMFGASRPIGGTAAAAARKASPPPAPRPPPVLVASGLKRTEQESAQRLAAAHGGRFLRQWQEGVTHVIVRVGPRLEAGRTLKFLQGVAARAWLVSPAWVEDSLAAGRIMPEDTYEAIDGATGEPGPRRARLTGGELFAGFVFCCVGPFRDVTMDQLESLIGQSGGAVASSPAALSSAPGRVRLIVAQEECDHDFAGWRRRHGIPSVSYEWLIDCVATQRLWSLLDNTLCGASEQELRAAGVPPELCLAETQDTEYFDSMGL